MKYQSFSKDDIYIGKLNECRLLDFLMNLETLIKQQNIKKNYQQKNKFVQENHVIKSNHRIIGKYMIVVNLGAYILFLRNLNP